MIEQETGPRRKLRVGLIGLGGVGQIHLRAYRGLDNVEVVAAAETRADVLEKSCTEHDIRPYIDHRDMLARERLDIACVLTPCASHEALVLDVAAAGVHVLCEKPMALSLDAADRMLAACTRHGVQFNYGASYRYFPALQLARRWIAEGHIGDVLMLREELIGGTGPEGHVPAGPAHYPHGGPGGSGMGLVDHGVHLIDAFAWLMNSEIVRSFGRGNIAGAPPHTEMLDMEFANGALGRLLYNDSTFGTQLPHEGVFSDGESWSLAGRPVEAGGWQSDAGCIHVHGTKGALRIFHYANVVIQVDARGLRKLPLLAPPPPVQFTAQMRAFAQALRDGEPAPTPGLAGRRALEVLLSAY